MSRIFKVSVSSCIPSLIDRYVGSKLDCEETKESCTLLIICTHFICNFSILRPSSDNIHVIWIFNIQLNGHNIFLGTKTLGKSVQIFGLFHNQFIIQHPKARTLCECEAFIKVKLTRIHMCHEYYGSCVSQSPLLAFSLPDSMQSQDKITTHALSSLSIPCLFHTGSLGQMG